MFFPIAMAIPYPSKIKATASALKPIMSRRIDNREAKTTKHITSHDSPL